MKTTPRFFSLRRLRLGAEVAEAARCCTLSPAEGTDAAAGDTDTACPWPRTAVSSHMPSGGEHRFYRAAAVRDVHKPGCGGLDALISESVGPALRAAWLSSVR